MSDANCSGGDKLRRRSAARLAAAQALFQHAAEPVATARLLHEFHEHRLDGQSDADAPLAPADRALFDELVTGALARIDDIDAVIARYLAAGWTLERLDRLMLQILRLGAYELMARPAVPRGVVVSEYVDLAHAFYDQREAGFVNALLDRLGREARAEP